jgi:hypothetical protein
MSLLSHHAENMYGGPWIMDGKPWRRSQNVSLWTSNSTSLVFPLSTRTDGLIAHRCPGYVREEITLATTILNSAVVAHDTPSPPEECPVCHEIVSTYHNFVKKKGSDFERPDLCIAFNSLAHPWPDTFQLLVDRRIPTLFTVRWSTTREALHGSLMMNCYRRTTARNQRLRRRCCVQLAQPCIPPLDLPIYTASGWLAGGFK